MRLDKSFRVILNSPIFSTMTVERATDRSIRFGAQDEGFLRVFIIKVMLFRLEFDLTSSDWMQGTAQDCTNLSRELQSRIQIIQRQQAVSKNTTPVRCLCHSNQIETISSLDQAEHQ